MENYSIRLFVPLRKGRTPLAEADEELDSSRCRRKTSVIQCGKDCGGRQRGFLDDSYRFSVYVNRNGLNAGDFSQGVLYRSGASATLNIGGGIGYCLRCLCFHTGIDPVFMLHEEL